MTERRQLEQAISLLDEQRATLGDAAVETAITALRQKLTTLEAGDGILTSELDGERKLVTVMFADISGFTALSEKMDPEAVRDLMNRCFDRLVPCIKRYEGVIDKFIGDEIMALFGAPVVHENDPERSLRAAIEMQAALEGFNTEQNTQLGIHFGINTGLVLAGGVGSSGRKDYSVMGDTVNLASRLEEVSKRGQVLVGPDTYRLTAALFEFEALAPVNVKGKAEPVPIYRLIGVKAGAASTRGLERKGLASPLVGRGQEFEKIKSCLESLSRGQGGVVGVIGEAGLGKSRLMAELRRSDQDAQWLEGKTLSFGQSISYLPFQQIVRHYTGIDEDDTELEAWDKLEKKIVALFSDSALDILPYLATLLAVEVRGEYVERVKYLDGEALGKRVFLAMRRFIERLARAQPLVVMFEDIHWMDSSSVELFEYILALVREVPLLLIGVSRPDPDSAGARIQKVCAEEYTDLYTEIRLAPLSARESVQLVNNLLAIDNLPERVRIGMTEKAEGNPFFIEEIIRSLLDMGAIERDPSSKRWRATAQIESVHIPDTVQGVIMARIDRLDEGVKQALRMAAVIGRSFLYRILRQVDQMDTSLDEHLAQLVQVELISAKKKTPELEYIFKHALAQEATYESILIQKRRDLHGRVGQAVEVLFASRLEEFYSLLAYHYAKAENWVKAQEYLFKSGDQAGKIAADTEALVHYQQAMDAYVRAFGDQWDPLQRALLDKKMAEVLYRRGENQQAADYFHKALVNLGHPLPRSKWGVRLAIFGEVMQQIVNLLRLIQRRSRTEVSLTPEFEAEFDIYMQMGMVDAFYNLEKVLMDGLRGLNRAETVGAHDQTSLALAGLGYGFTAMKLRWLAKVYLDQAMEIAEGTTSAPARALVNYLTGFFYQGQGQLDESLHCYRVSQQLFTDIGNLVEVAMSESQIAEISFNHGDFFLARAICDRNVNMAREVQNINTECYFLLGVAKGGSVMGDWDKVVEQMQRSIDLAKKIPNYLHYVETLGYLAWHYVRTDQLDLALGCLAEAVTGIKKYKSYGMYNMRVYNTYAEVCLTKAEQTGAGRAGWLQEARHWLSKGLNQAQNARASLPEVMRLLGTYHWIRGKPLQARRWWEKSLQMANSAGERYQTALTHLEIGRRMDDRAHLELAVTILDEVGAKPDLERAKGLLAR